MRTFEDHELPEHWTTADLIAPLKAGRPDTDAFVLRVLAARVAHAGADNEDPLSTMKDLRLALDSLAAAVDGIITGLGHGPKSGEEVAEFAATIDHLARASDGLHNLTGWF